jgi:transcriptional regulator with XRE-family HTH domain
MSNRLREIRFQRNLPQIQLALKTKIHFSTLSRIEHGYIKPTPEQKKKLAKALNVDEDWLFPPENEKSVENK